MTLPLFLATREPFRSPRPLIQVDQRANHPKGTIDGKQWYYSKNNQQQGPVSSGQLKQLAVSGQLQPSDLVWKEGMGQWVEGRKIKGLFPAAPPANSQVPPPIPTAPNIPSVPTAAIPTNQPPSIDQPPALWNPTAAGRWSFPLSWAFGAFLLARNWKSLGDPARATRCMIWFYSIFPWILLAVITPDTQVVSGFFKLGWVLIVTAFYWLEVKPQIKLVKERFNDHYPRKSWGKPVGIGVCGWLAAIVLAASVENPGISGGSGNPRPNVGQQQIAATVKVYDDIEHAGVDLRGKDHNGVMAVMGRPNRTALTANISDRFWKRGDECWTYSQAIYNKFTGDNGAILVFFRDGKVTEVEKEDF